MKTPVLCSRRRADSIFHPGAGLLAGCVCPVIAEPWPWAEDQDRFKQGL